MSKKKGFSGVREYCQFIFKGAQAILASVKIVDDHVKKIIDATKYLDKFRDVIGSNKIQKSTSNDAAYLINHGLSVKETLNIIEKRQR